MEEKEASHAEPRSDQATEGEVRARGGALRKFVTYASVLVLGWLVLGGVVLWWQPGRFLQVGILIAAFAVGIALPKKVHSKALGALAVLALMGAILYLPSYLLSSEIEFTIRAANREADKKLYLVATDHGASAPDRPGETFKNADAPLFWKLNSSDWEGVLKTMEGQRVRARVIGIRFADRSVYRNLVWVEAIEESPPVAVGP